jgi:hypothetical protein
LGARQIGASYPYSGSLLLTRRGYTGYIRFLSNKIYEAYDFEGCPLTLEFRPIRKQKQFEACQFEEGPLSGVVPEEER